MNIEVVKKDGTTETFSSDKLITSIARAGVPIQDCNRIAAKLTPWIESSSKDGKIDSSIIRDKIIEELIVEFPAEADSYKAYKH